ncbi:MAG: dockerin type I repeat-containing protein [Ruminococcus sp.]|nr:dockerin type I repeat-containing protein [Ruminococcus sp.]
MKKNILSFLLGLAISIQCLSFTVNAENNGMISADRVIQLEYDESAEPVEIEVYEGESVQLDFQLDPEIYDLEYIQCFNSEKVVVSHTGKLIAYESGQERVEVYVKVRDHFHTLDFAFNVNVLPNENISPEDRAELNRLKGFQYTDYRRRKLELVGAIDEDSPRLSLDKVQEFIDTSDDYREIFKKVSNYVGYPDDVSGSGTTSYGFWFDPKGNEAIYIGYDNEYIIYGKTADDGTVIGSQMLYPEKTEFVEDGKSKNSSYIEYNQIKPKGYGTVKLNFIDKSTGEPFTETNGTFQLVSNGGTFDEKVIKSWTLSESSEIILSELSRECSYEIRYIGDYQGVFPEDYRYLIDYSNGRGRFSFGFDTELSINVYLRKNYRIDPFLIGDANSDNLFNVADVVTLQRWLLSEANTVVMNWRAADLNRDEILNVFDLSLMKKKLITKD